VRGYVTKHHVDAVTIDEPLAIGRPLPPRVKTYVIEGNPRYESYRYARVNNQTLLIDGHGNVLGSVD
jgi:hypothetical protein